MNETTHLYLNNGNEVTVTRLDGDEAEFERVYLHVAHRFPWETKEWLTVGLTREQARIIAAALVGEEEND